MDVRKIIVHCSATPEGRANTVDDIRAWHVKNFGWADIGYHYVIHLDGSIHAGRPEGVPGAHCAGHNHDSIGVCYIGGLARDGVTPKDTRTPEQCAALDWLLDDLRARYPKAEVHGHNFYNPRKACPCFEI